MFSNVLNQEKSNAAVKFLGDLAAELNSAVDQTLIKTKPVPTKFIAADAIKTDVVDGKHLTMRLYLGPNARIERIIRVAIPRKPFMRAQVAHDRVPIAPFTLIDAQRSGLEFNFEGCIAWTRGLGLKDVNAYSRIKDNSLREIIREDEERVAKINTNRKPVIQEEEADHGNIIAEATGTVISAQDKQILPEGREPYWIFEVSVQSNRGVRTEFIGKDLKEKFLRREFIIGDVVHIAKRSTSFEIADGERSKKRMKNFYTIRVIEKTVS